ncbi:MAG: hypothetical protein JXA94_06255 [Parachlamydiales bacterium]|nr:hypothetical protein [Parachlamydiales bacterium]
MSKLIKVLCLLSFVFISSSFTENKTTQNFKSFTGKITGNKVRMRSSPDLDSEIIKQLNKNELVLVTKDCGDFWAISPSSSIKAYIFRSYIIDNVVEADRVNVRLHPNLDSPVIGQLKSKQKVSGNICETNNKWMEIDLPSDVYFYIAKEYVTYAGNVEFYAEYQKRKDEVERLLNSAYFITQAECKKPFNEMNPEEAIEQFDQIIKNFSDFSQYVQQAKDGLALLQDNYLQKKIAYLESKANITRSDKAELTKAIEKASNSEANDYQPKKTTSLTSKMKFWESVEDSLYLTWTTFHPEKKLKEFYKEQEINAIAISGVVESYSQSIKNKPGDFIVKGENTPSAYLYSTKVDLDQYVGKKVKLKVSPRPNNNFAFPAYFVNSVEVVQ